MGLSLHNLSSHVKYFAAAFLTFIRDTREFTSECFVVYSRFIVQHNLNLPYYSSIIPYYSSIILNSFHFLLFPKLCRHIRRSPTGRPGQPDHKGEPCGDLKGVPGRPGKPGIPGSDRKMVILVHQEEMEQRETEERKIFQRKILYNTGISWHLA